MKSIARKLLEGINEGKREEIIDYIKTQINFDITPFIDEKNSTRKYLTIDFDAMPDLKQREIKRLATAYGKTWYRLESNGGLGTALIFN